MHKIQQAILELSSKKNIAKLTLREIGEEIGEPSSPQKIKHHLGQLESKGLLRIDRDKEKTFGVNNAPKKSGIIAVPIFGAANCGEATIFADNRVEGYLRISEKMLTKKKNIFAIKAVGTSMNKASISNNSIDDGDYVIINSENKNPKNGEYVLSVIDGVANIKKFKQDPKTQVVTLKSESRQDYPPIIIHPDDFGSYSIAGVVSQVIKV